MQSATFYARGDSDTANNAWLNVINTNRTPVTELVFVATDGGDIDLEYNGGLPDPDTVVLVDGVEMTFTVEFSGTTPIVNSLLDVGGMNLQGLPIVVITTEDGQRLFFIMDADVTADVAGDIPNGALDLTAVDDTTDIILCFAEGSLIATPDGERPVETLRPGDKVLNRDGDAVDLLWVVTRHVGEAELARAPATRPIRIAAHAFGPGQPHSPLTVSPQHRILISDWRNELLFATEEVLVPAKFLLGDIASQVCPKGGVTYHHLLFANHEIVISNGLTTESYQPAQQALDGQGEATRQEFFDLLAPDQSRSLMQRSDAFYSLKSYEAPLLATG